MQIFSLLCILFDGSTIIYIGLKTYPGETYENATRMREPLKVFRAENNCLEFEKEMGYMGEPSCLFALTAATKQPTT